MFLVEFLVEFIPVLPEHRPESLELLDALVLERADNGVETGVVAKVAPKTLAHLYPPEKES